MAAELSVELKATLDDLEKNIGKAKDLLEGYEESAKKVSSQNEETEKSSDRLAGAFGNIDRGAGKAVSALGGPGGLVAAVAGLAFVSDILFENTRRAWKEQSQFALTLGKAEAAARSEAITLNTLFEAASDTTRATEERQNAIDRLNKQYKTYLGNLDLESINTAKVADQVDRLTNSLFKQAKQKGAQQALTDLYAKQFEILANAGQKVDFFDVVFEAFKSGGTVVGAFGAQTGLVTDELLKNAAAIDNVEKALKGFINETLVNAPEEIKKATSAAKPEIVTKEWTAKAIQDLFDKIDKQLFLDQDPPDFAGAFQAIIDDQGEEALNYKPTIVVDDADIVAQEKITAAVERINESINQSIAGFKAGAIGDLGLAIGEAIAEGANVIGAIGQSLSASFARFLSEMGDQLIQYGLLAKAKGAIDVALAKGGPASIAAGVAAVAIGVALKAASGAFASVARGGFGASSVAGQGTQTFSGSASSATTSAFDTGGTVVFEIQGTKLVGVLNRTLKKDRRTVADLI